MDLSFSDFDRHVEVTALPADLNVLLVGIAARQAGSVTARLQARLAMLMGANPLLAPIHGCFNAPVARLLQEEKKQ